MVVLSVDEASVVIGLLDVQATGSEPHPQLAELARKYQSLPGSRVVDASVAADGGVPDSLVARVRAASSESERLRGEVDARLDESRELRAQQEALVSALRAAIELIGTAGPLEERRENDPDLADVRALLRAVAA